ncbi:MAG: PepSY domain-containing protein, partial [Candidatus Accumulibacter sp.]|nr:PepSY domain-containing protein [Accumulibacter sp.]
QGGGSRRGGQQVTLDPATGEVVKPRETAGGDFLNDFHYELHAMPREWGRRIVGIAAMAMFIALLSGVITHKKIFTDFFTFRPGKGQRSWLDLHNVSSVLALPFHLMITYTGVILVAATLLPMGSGSRFGGGSRPQMPQEEQRGGRYETVMLAPVGPMIAFAEQRWGAPVSRLTVSNPGRPDARVELQAAYNSSLLQSGHHGSSRSLSFSGASGETLGEAEGRSSTTISGAHSLLGGLHRALFAEPLLRWLFFLSGMGGTVMIATGLVLWSVKRAEKRKGAPGHFGHRLVDVLNVGTVAGLVLAVAGYFWANRLLPVDLADRAGWEVRCFFVVWLAAFVHPLLRPPRRAWIEQLIAAGLLLASIPALNFATTRAASLAATIPTGNWIVAGFDLTTCAIGAALLHTAWKVSHHRGRVPRHPVQASSRAAEEIE